jgi:hypothetical protein
MATKATIRDRAANELGLLPVGQTLASQHQTRIETAYDEVYAQLKVDGLNTWASDGSCADELTPHVVALVAFSCLNTYPVSPERYQRITFTASQAIPRIKALVTPEYESIDEPTDY